MGDLEYAEGNGDWEIWTRFGGVGSTDQQILIGCGVWGIERTTNDTLLRGLHDGVYWTAENPEVYMEPAQWADTWIYWCEIWSEHCVMIP